MTKICDHDKQPCPLPKEGRGRGDSSCEQNGVCQRVNFNDLPTLQFVVTPPIEPAGESPIHEAWCDVTKNPSTAFCNCNLINRLNAALALKDAELEAMRKDNAECKDLLRRSIEQFRKLAPDVVAEAENAAIRENEEK